MKTPIYEFEEEVDLEELDGDAKAVEFDSEDSDE